MKDAFFNFYRSMVRKVKYRNYKYLSRSSLVEFGVKVGCKDILIMGELCSYEF